MNLSSKLASCTNDTSMDFFLIIDLSRPLNTNLNVKFAPLWNVMRSCYITPEFRNNKKLLQTFNAIQMGEVFFMNIL